MPPRASTAIRLTRSRRDLEVGVAVVAEVDLENAGLTGLQAKCDLLAGVRAVDLQDAMLERRVLVEGGGLTLRGRERGTCLRRAAAMATNCLMPMR